MTIQIELNESILGRIKAEADRLGVDPQEVVKHLLETAYPSPVPSDQKIVLKAWDQFVETRPIDSPILSEYAMSRESIYENERLAL